MKHIALKTVTIALLFTSNIAFASLGGSDDDSSEIVASGEEQSIVQEQPAQKADVQVANAELLNFLNRCTQAAMTKPIGKAFAIQICADRARAIYGEK